MIYGIVAAEGEITSQSFAPPFAGEGQANFVTGSYEWNGSSLTAAEVVDRTDWIGASGLAIPGSAAAGAELVHAGLTTFLATCQWTAVMEVEILHTGGLPADASLLLTVQNSGGSYYIKLNFQNEWEAVCYAPDGNPFAYDAVNAISTGIHKLAVTRADNRIALSVDGSAVQEDTATCTLPVIGFPMVNFFLGGWADSTTQAVNIRSVAFYDAQANSQLPVLSA